MIGTIGVNRLKGGQITAPQPMPTRILLVEDDPLARMNIALYLRRAQFEVDSAASGEEAIHLITSIDKYDVLISDLRLPGAIDGIDVISR